MEFDCPLLSWTQVNAREALQCPVGNFHAADIVMQVEFRNLVAFHVAGIGDIYRDENVRAGAGWGCPDGETVVLEGGVAEAKSKREQRRTSSINILRCLGWIEVIEVG